MAAVQCSPYSVAALKQWTPGGGGGWEKKEGGIGEEREEGRKGKGK